MGIDFRGRKGNVSCLVNLARGSSGAARQARGRAPRLVSSQRDRERERERFASKLLFIPFLYLL